MDTTEILTVWMALALAGALAALGVHWRFWKHHTDLRLWTRVAASALLVGALYGAFGTVVGLVKTLRAVSGGSSDPAQSARILAEGLSEAMSCTALSLIFFVPPVVGLFIVMMKRRSAAATDVPR